MQLAARPIASVAMEVSKSGNRNAFPMLSGANTELRLKGNGHNIVIVI
jgi:hypothetical protein